MEWLGKQAPSVFTYYSTRMMLAALTSLAISIFFGPWFIRKLYEMKIGQSIRTDECPLLGELHKKKKDTPTMGGILILTAMAASLILWMDPRSSFTLLLLATTLSLGILGGYDDLMKLKYKNAKGISGRKKLAIQLLLSLAIAFYLYIPAVSESIHFGDWFAPPIAKEQQTLVMDTSIRTVAVSQLSLQEYAGQLYLPFVKGPIVTFSGIFLVLAGLLVILVVTGSSNAVNLTDGLDGLAAGCLVTASLALGIFAFVSNHLEIARYLNILYIEGSGEIAIYLSAMFGATLGFLWYNGYPAQVFMGDTGSLALGGILGVAAVLLKRELLLVIIGGVFVAEALSVIIQVASYRLRNKKRVFLCSPLHHHYEYKGWPETKVVIRFWIIALILAVIGIASLKFQ
ncbi:MAG: phospho-N-acetylmuramoyl-pentapeptide-transferase [Chlamydiales bacterium]|nr:phospho-N-acetylmuramoyl-pentapeptide-transferase [Chlamydiia bacterium]MCP5507253.1 phospho-N-acetylmuramoyl-pentapeptide-transferase [Chlamydiales bacterium]